MHVEADLRDHRNCLQACLASNSYSLFCQTCLETTPFPLHNIEGHLLEQILSVNKNRKAQSFTPGYETTTLSLSWRRTFIFPRWLLDEGWTLYVVWYVNFLRLWKYFYDQSMWMFRIALCRLLICFSTTHKRFQHHTAFAWREEGYIGSFVMVLINIFVYFLFWQKKIILLGDLEKYFFGEALFGGVLSCGSDV